MTIYFNKESYAYHTYKCLIKCYREKIGKPIFLGIDTEEDLMKTISIMNKQDMVRNKTVQGIALVVFDSFNTLIDQTKSNPSGIEPFIKIINAIKQASFQGKREELTSKHEELMKLIEDHLLNPNLKAGIA